MRWPPKICDPRSCAHLDQLAKKPIDTLLNERYEKFRKMGKVFEGS